MQFHYRNVTSSVGHRNDIEIIVAFTVTGTDYSNFLTQLEPRLQNSATIENVPMIQVKRLEPGSVIARLIVYMPRSVDDLATLHDLQYAFDSIAMNSGGFLTQERLSVESAGKNSMS